MRKKNIIFFTLVINIFSCSHIAQNPIQPEVKKEVTLAFVGDVILHERLRTREEKTKEGYQVIWQDIQPYLSSADLTYANLEGPVAPDLGGLGSFPMFNFPEKIIPNLKDSGFDVVSTANNHALDRLSKGIQKTIANLRKYKLNYSGTISSQAALDNKTETWWTLTPIDSNGTQFVAWLACTEATNGMLDRKNQVLYCFKDREKIKSYIQQLISDPSVEFIILNPHWGTEDKFKIASYRSKWAQEMIDQGAAAVVGAHPHVIQKIENLKSADGRDAVVNYSLGNFISNQRDLKNRLSMIYYIKMQQADGKFSLKESKALPLWLNRTIKKDRTAVYRLAPIWDFSKLHKDIKTTWFENINPDYLFKDEAELKSFLNISSAP